MIGAVVVLSTWTALLIAAAFKLTRP